MNLHLTPADEAVIDKVTKLIAFANSAKDTNEAMAANYMEKAMELLAAHNLDMAMIQKDGSGGHAPRKDKKTNGGLYSWQRELWDAVARLNFCKYWFIRGLTKGSSYEHRILGRAENVLATELMATYLQDTVERLAVDYGKKYYPGKSRFIRELIAFREGVSTRLYWRLHELRNQRLAEDKAKAEAQRAKYAGSGGGTALVLADVIQTEEDLNTDYIYGYEPGTTARQRAEANARRAAADAAANAALAQQQAEWAAFAEANPDEAARILKVRADEEAKRIAERDRRWAEEDARNAKRPARERKLTSREERMQSHSFSAGYSKGAEVNLDKQIDNTKQGRIGK